MIEVRTNIMEPGKQVVGRICLGDIELDISGVVNEKEDGSFYINIDEESEKKIQTIIRADGIN